jgi:glycerol-3-phosphate dehydrogenase
MDDARINVALATTAAMAGAAVANHVRVVALTKARARRGRLCCTQ